MTKNHRIALYLRVSTAEQSTELQAHELKSFCKARGWSNIRVYEDVGKSGTTDKRPSLKELLKVARQRKIDVLVCWKLDRLFRSLKHLVVTLQELEELGVEFISVKDQLDLTTSSGRLLMQVIGAMAEFEAALVRERVVAGLRAAKAKGTQLGRRPSINRQVVANLRAQGMTLSQIANEIGASKGGVSKSLKKLSLASRHGKERFQN